MTHDYSESFQRQRESIRFQVERERQSWVERFATPERSVRTVVNFGCGVQYTPHLMIETVSVLTVLGVDFVAVAGPQWCCGMPYLADDEADSVPGAARNMTANSTKRMAAFKPAETAHWCGAWWPRLKETFPEGPPFALTQITALIARALLERRGDIPWKRDVGAGALLHLMSRHPGQLADRATPMAAMEASVSAALALVPGLRILGDAPAPSSGLPCDDRAPLDGMSVEEIRGVQDELAAHAEAAGAGLILTAHQLCHREWGKLTSQRLPIRHFISLIADGLGVAEPDRYHAYWQMRDIGAIVARARTAWESWGMDEAQATEVATRLFGATSS